MVPADEGGRLMRTDLLDDPIDGLDEALAAVDAFDDALVAGLLRPQPGQTDGLAALADALAGTPSPPSSPRPPTRWPPALPVRTISWRSPPPAPRSWAPSTTR